MCTINRLSSARDLARRCRVAFHDVVERATGLAQAARRALPPAEEPAVPDETGQPAPRQHAAGNDPARVPPPLPDLLPAPVLQDALLWDALSRDALSRDPMRQGRPAGPGQALPRRRPEESAAEEPGPSVEAGYSPPPPDVLTRVLDALREL